MDNVITNIQGTFRLYRKQGEPDVNGVYDAELWTKDGTKPSESLFMRLLSTSATTEPLFVRLPGTLV